MNRTRKAAVMLMLLGMLGVGACSTQPSAFIGTVKHPKASPELKVPVPKPTSSKAPTEAVQAPLLKEPVKPKPRKLKAVLTLPREGSTVGVGMPVHLHFNYEVPKSLRKIVLSGLKVYADGESITGGWRWVSATEVHYKPSDYWPGKAEIQITADLGAVKTSKLVGASLMQEWGFTTGPALVLKVNGRTHTMKAIQGGRLVKLIPVSLGKPGWESRNGTKVIMTKQTDYTMHGTDESGPYAIQVADAFRITNTGEFIHSAPWSVQYQGVVNHSHGCTNVSPQNARWLRAHVLIGTPVEYHRTGGSLMTLDNGWGEWNTAGAAWQTGGIPMYTDQVARMRNARA